MIVGAGVAGLSVALGLDRAYVITAKEMGSTWWAQGGIAVALADEDSPQAHAADTVAVCRRVGGRRRGGRPDPGGPDAVARLIELGAEFDRDDEGPCCWEGRVATRPGGWSMPMVMPPERR